MRKTNRAERDAHAGHWPRRLTDSRAGSSESVLTSWVAASPSPRSLCLHSQHPPCKASQIHRAIPCPTWFTGSILPYISRFLFFLSHLAPLQFFLLSKILLFVQGPILCLLDNIALFVANNTYLHFLRNPYWFITVKTILEKKSSGSVFLFECRLIFLPSFFLKVSTQCITDIPWGQRAFF